jgi:hypothetical protein
VAPSSGESGGGDSDPVDSVVLIESGGGGVASGVGK